MRRLLVAYLVQLTGATSSDCDFSYDFGQVADAHATELSATRVRLTNESAKIVGVHLPAAINTVRNSSSFGAQFLHPPGAAFPNEDPVLHSRSDNWHRTRSELMAVKADDSQARGKSMPSEQLAVAQAANAENTVGL
eukprot:SAG31_NODE_13744_length_850_cov_0.652463_1_plen_136_part_10